MHRIKKRTAKAIRYQSEEHYGLDVQIRQITFFL